MRTIGVAIAVPEPWGSELQAWRASFGDPLADSIPTHVTLLPPSDIEDDDLVVATEHLLAVSAGHVPFDVHLRGTATFRPVSPVVFMDVVDGIAGCEQLAGDVRSGVLRRQLGFPYHPHVTVAHDLSEEVLDKAFAELASYECRFTVSAFSLYEHGHDAVWRPQRDFVLGGALPQVSLSQSG